MHKGPEILTDNHADLVKKAYTDPVTGLPNRYAQELKFNELVNSGKEFGIIVTDVCNFGIVNNRYDYQEGDDKLNEIGEFLKQKVRKEVDQVSVGRLGGDEFLLLVDLSDRHVPHDDEVTDNRTSEEMSNPERLDVILNRIVEQFAQEDFVKEYNSRSDLKKKEKLGLRGATAVHIPGENFDELKKRARIEKDTAGNYGWARRIAISGLEKALDKLKS